MKVFDCFPFNDELDLLEIRLHELSDVVDCFVISEATFDHRGIRKPLYFLLNEARFSAFHDRIRHVVCRNCPVQTPYVMAYEWDPIAWWNEYHQTDSIKAALADCEDQDIIVLSDVDEIPNCEQVRSFDGVPKRLRNVFYHYTFNHPDKPNDDHFHWSAAPVIARWLHIKHDSMRAYRDHDFGSPAGMPRGWHFTWFGGIDAIAKKERWYNHPLKSRIQDRLLLGDAYGYEAAHGWPLKMSKDISALPSCVRSNLPRYAHMFDERFVKEFPEYFEVQIG